MDSFDDEKAWQSSKASEFSGNIFDDDSDPNQFFFPDSISDYIDDNHNEDNLSSLDNNQHFNSYSKSFPECNNLNESKTKQKTVKKDEMIVQHIEPSSAIYKMLFGIPVVLEIYKSKEEKLSLLDQAILSADGDAIIRVILFLEKTLKPSIFNLEISRRPSALNHYLYYISSTLSTSSSSSSSSSLSSTFSSSSVVNNVVDIFSFFDKPEKAAMIKLNQAFSCKDPFTKQQLLEKCLNCHLWMKNKMSLERKIVQMYLFLIQLQAPIQENDRKNPNDILKRIEVKNNTNLVDSSALSTLYYCCLYHYQDAQNLFSSPLSIKQNQNLSDKQFVWKAMGALVRLEEFQLFDQLFITKSWTGMKKIKPVVEFERVVLYLHYLLAPEHLKSKYCLLIEDKERRVEVAKKILLHKIVIETYKEMRNRAAIREYQLILNENSSAFLLASQIINDNSIKWIKD